MSANTSREVTASAFRYLTATTDPAAASDTINQARHELIRALAGTTPARPEPSEGYEPPGSRWRIGIDRRGDDGDYHPIRELHTSSDDHPGSLIDEVVIASWLHVEQMDHDVWLVRVGDWHTSAVVAGDGTAAAVVPPWLDAPDPDYREVALEETARTLEAAAAKVATLTHDRHRLVEALDGLVAAVAGTDGPPPVADATRRAERSLADSADTDRAIADAAPGGGAS